MRPVNIFKSVDLELAFTPQVAEYLNDLAMQGTYGSSANEAARVLITHAISDLIKSGVLTKRRWTIKNGELVPVDLAKMSAASLSENISQKVETLYESRNLNEISSEDIYSESAPLIVEANEWVLRQIKRNPDDIAKLSRGNLSLL